MRVELNGTLRVLNKLCLFAEDISTEFSLEQISPLGASGSGFILMLLSLARIPIQLLL